MTPNFLLRLYSATKLVIFFYYTNKKNKYLWIQSIFFKVNGNVTAKTLAATLAVSARTIERELNFLRKEAYITKEDKSNKGIWKVLK